ncbi:hypothetical protein D3C81_2131950 [compost metagenome]
MVVARLAPLVPRLRWAFSDMVLVLMTCAMVRFPCRQCVRQSSLTGFGGQWLASPQGVCYRC